MRNKNNVPVSPSVDMTPNSFLGLAIGIAAAVIFGALFALIQCGCFR